MRVSLWLYLLHQTLCSLCLLLALGLCAGAARRSPLRVIAAAALGGAASLAAALTASPLLRLALFLLLAGLTPLLAFPGLPRRMHPRMALLSVMSTLWIAGLMRAAAPLALPSAVMLLLACAALGMLPRLTRASTALPRCTTVIIRKGSGKLTLTALIDSGNLLRDAITDLPVILISRRAGDRLLPLPGDGMLLPGMRLMSVRTVAGTAMMTVFRPDSVFLLTNGTWLPAQALIGLSPDGYEGFQALVPSSLLADPFAPHVTDLSSSQGG